MWTLPPRASTTPLSIDTHWYNDTWSNVTNMVSGSGNSTASTLMGALWAPISDNIGPLGLALIFGSILATYMIRGTGYTAVMIGTLSLAMVGAYLLFNMVGAILAGLVLCLAFVGYGVWKRRIEKS